MDSFSMYNLKDTVIPPDQYLGANVGKWKFSDGSNCQWMNGRDYIANAINLPNNFMEKKGKVFVYGKRAKGPMLMSDRPELDLSQLLNPKEAQEYQQFVRIKRWIIELGWFEIIYEVSLLSSHLSMTRKGNMEALTRIFVYPDNDYGNTIIIVL